MATKTTATLQELEEEIGVEKMRHFLQDIETGLELDVEKIRITIPTWEDFDNTTDSNSKSKNKPNMICMKMLARVLSNRRYDIEELDQTDLALLKPILDKYCGKRLVVNFRKLSKQKIYQKVVDMDAAGIDRGDIAKKTGLSRNYIAQIIHRYKKLYRG